MSTLMAIVPIIPVINASLPLQAISIKPTLAKIIDNTHNNINTKHINHINTNTKNINNNANNSINHNNININNNSINN